MAPERRVSLVLLCDGAGRVLLLRRPPRKHCAGLWSLPGGKQRAGESALACARRELFEECGVRADGWRLCHRWRYDYGGRGGAAPGRLAFTLFAARMCGPAERVRGESAWAWFDPAAVEAAQLPPANGAIMPLTRWLV